MPHSGDPLKAAKAVVVSWYGVLFDRDRRIVHEVTRDALRRWGVEVSDDELVASRGPTGRAQFERLCSMPRIAEEFRARQRRWVTEEDLEAMARDFEPRLAAAPMSSLNADARDALRLVRARGLRTAAICCAPMRAIARQLEALAGAGIALDCVVTADEVRQPAPAPWAIFEVQRLLELDQPAAIACIDDTPAGWAAARNAGARSIALLGQGMPSADAQVVLRSLDELGAESAG